MLCFAFHIEGKQDIEEIKYHAFFVDVNWDVILPLAHSELKSTQTNNVEDSRILLQLEILHRCQILFFPNCDHYVLLLPFNEHYDINIYP